PAGIRDNVSRVTIPARTLTVDTKYVFVARFYKIDKSVGDTVSYTFTAVAPTPTVRIGGGASKMVVGPTNIRVTATIVDAYDTATAGTWSCVGSCPSSVTNALSSGNNSLLVIAGPVSAGDFALTLTYKGVTSASLTVSVKSTEVPAVQIAFTTPRAIMPSTYLYGQTMGFKATVTYGGGATTLKWLVNEKAYGTNSTLVLSGIDLLQSTDSSMVANTIVLRATSAADTTIVGEGSFTVYVLANQSATVTIENSGNLKALSDPAMLTITSSEVTGATVSYEVGYLDGSSKIRMLRTGDTKASFVTPIPPAGANTLKAYVDVLVNGYFSATASSSARAVDMPDLEEAKNSQLAALESDDPAAKAAAVANLGSLLSRDSSTTKDDATAAKMASALQSIAADPSVPAELVLKAATNALGAASNTTELKAATLSIVKDMENKVTTDNAQDFLSLITQVPPDAETSKVVNSLAQNVGDKLAPGESTTMTAGGVTVNVQKTSASAVAASTSSAGESKMTFGAGLPGVAPDADLVVSGSSAEFNVYGASNGVSASTGVTQIIIGVNGNELSVKELSKENRILIELKSANPSRDICQYWDVDTNAWSTAGVEKIAYTATTIVCATNHLTAFAGFAGPASGSSSGRVVVSALVVALVALLQVAFRA
ncbi:MAG: hypothetical protein KF881_14465, partial [Acidobacteria bacterium]|nr:hypothetical protein [Acidobacteriota bacterium]